ncbi:cytidine and deoxycytidylate deaminase zinc-binding region domain-containing protein [Sarocladium implicatum]|nr:cytidine and deoxycytidylate deaminase zinc-binding region domain-containing protein [Sarocladium implicatum]
MVSAQDIEYLRQCVSLASEALTTGDAPFGSVLVNTSTSTVLARDRNRTVSGSSPLLPGSPQGPDATLHPEFTLARWAGLNLTPEERAKCTVYTSGEHCAMCAAAHAWVGLGRIVFASSTVQLGAWRDELGVVQAKVVNPLGINEVAPGIEIEGPVEEFAEQMKELHRKHRDMKAGKRN